MNNFCRLSKKLFKIIRKFSVQFFLQNIELWCRSLAPLTIGGPSSTSLETPGTQLPGRGPPPDPRLLRKMAGPGYPWLMGPGFPPPGLGSPHSPHSPGSPFIRSPGEITEHRKRHLSSERSRGCGSPAPPIFSPRDKESSRSGLAWRDTGVTLRPSHEARGSFIWPLSESDPG